MNELFKKKGDNNKDNREYGKKLSHEFVCVRWDGQNTNRPNGHH